MRVPLWLCPIIVSLACLARPAAAPAQQTAMVFQGDGLTVRVLTISDDETTVSGELIRGDQRFPFTGKASSDGTTTTVAGSFRAGDSSFNFTSTHREGEKSITFVTDGTTYKLNEINPADAPPVKPDSAPAVKPTDPKPAVVQQNALAPAANERKDLPQTFKMRTAEFRDINMGNVVAYTMLVPDGWKVDGHVEWNNEKTPYPQKIIDVTGPDNSRVAYRPAQQYQYWEFKEAARRDMARMGSNLPLQGGVAPPKEPSAWLASVIAQNNNKGYTNVRLVNDNRDTAAEEAIVAQNRAAGINNNSRWEVHIATIGYEIDGVPMTEEINFNLATSPPVDSGNMNTWVWGLYINVAVRAPSASFERQKPLLYASANSIRTVPQWFTQQQIILMEITRNNFVDGMKAIAERGKYYSQITDQQMADWRKSQTPGDIAQVKRVNAIYEVHDFPGPDGTEVKLPFHYQNYYSDGKGNYLMTNTSEQPTSEWSKIEPINR